MGGLRNPIYAVLIFFCSVLVASAQNSEPAPLPVGTVVASRKAVEKTMDFRGRVDAVQRVEIRARVTGYLDDVLFEEGSTVAVGQPLYRIEDGLFKAAVGQAQGALERSKAAQTLSAIQLQRAGFAREAIRYGGGPRSGTGV